MKLLVSGTKYPDEHAFAEVYEGEDEAQLYVEIAKKHSYNQFGDDQEQIDDIGTMRQAIESTNGDGCDFITCIVEIKGKHKIVF